MIRKEKLEELKMIFEKLKVTEIEESKTNEEAKFINSKCYDIKLNNGINFVREKLLKNNKDGSASIIVPVTNQNEIITVIEPRIFTKHNVSVSFPAGYIEKDEDPKNAALRELKEETGYVPEEIIEIDSFYQDEGCSEAFNHIFLALNCQKQFKQSLDKDEVVEFMQFNYEELLELEEMNYIKGCNTKLALEKVKPYIKVRK